MLEIKLDEKQVLLITLGLRSVEHRFFELESDAIKIEELLGSSNLKTGEMVMKLKEFSKNGSIKK